MYWKKSIEEVKKELASRAEFNKAAAAAWDAVTIKRKKDGSDYKNIAAAVDGARIAPDVIGNTEICVCFKACGRYEHDTISIYGYCDELPATDPRYKKPTGWQREKYIFTAAEVENAIQKRIARCNNYAAEYGNDISRADALGNAYRNAVEAAEKALADATDHYKHTPDGGLHTSSLFWLITEQA